MVSGWNKMELGYQPSANDGRDDPSFEMVDYW